MAKNHRKQKKAKRRTEATSQNLRAVVERLDQRILQAVDPALDDDAKTQVTSWAHHHLIAAIVIDYDRYLVDPPLPDEIAESQLKPSWHRIALLQWMLKGKVRVDKHLALHPSSPLPAGYELVVTGIANDASPGSEGALAPELVNWLHRRLTHAAQRTRLHTDIEIALILEWTDAALIAHALESFGLDRDLGLPVRPIDGVAVAPHLTTMAVRGHTSIMWTPKGPAFAALKPLPFAAASSPRQSGTTSH